MLLAIDPGEDAGWALFSLASDGYRVIACGLGDPRMSDTVRVSELTKIVIERPCIYPDGRQKARPNDVVTLAVRAGEWGGLFRQWGEVSYVQPWQWKGTTNKSISSSRTWSRLSEAERSVVERAVRGGGKRGKPIAPSKVHNMMDGIGIGLHAAGRGDR
jgi:hypothetical protein